MAQTEIISNILRSDSFPVEVLVSAESNCGILKLALDNDWTEQMLCELPAINITIYTTTGEKYMYFDIDMSTVNENYQTKDGGPRPTEPYSKTIYNLPPEFKFSITPLFDEYALESRNMLIENGIESGVLWDTPTNDFSISIDFEEIESGGGGGGTPEQTITTDGTPPLSFESNGSAASAYSISGDMVQTGTQSKSVPIYPQEVGDLVSSGEHAGEYAITMEIGGTTKTIYLDEPLRKIGDYTDTIDSDGTVTRRIAKITLDGTEPWGYTGGMHKLPFDTQYYSPPLYLRELKLISVCSHYTPIANQSQASLQNEQMTFLVSSSGTNNMYVRDTTYSDSTGFKAYLAAQYSAGTPVCVWYIRATDATETVTVPTLTPSKGSNTLAFDTSLQPSYASITCTIGGGGGGGSTSANKVSYSNTDSGLKASNVQKAIDELSSIPKQLYGIGYARDTGDLASGESLTLNKTNIKKNNTFSFMAKITSFSKILIGQGFDTYSGAWAEITDTKLIVHNYAQSDSTVEYTHGLTISDYIYVQIFVSIAKADIVIYSNGSSFKQANANWFGCNGTYFAKSDGSTLTDCVLTWSSEDFQKPIWVFGDSYIGLNNVKRWATQFRNAGFADNVLFNGYAGEASSDAITALTNALALGKPNKLVWCLGMNDGGDTGNTPSAKYSSGIAQVESICTANGIELIYATIPSIPNQSNEGKNTYVRKTGKRYIDFAKAVGASSSGVWYTGMLDVDNVHPTETGAIALYHRAIADCPELTY